MSLSDRWHDFWADYWYKRWTGREVGSSYYDMTTSSQGSTGEQERAEAETQAEEQKRAAEEKRAADEQRAAEKKRAEDAKRAADKKRADEDRRVDDAKRAAEEAGVAGNGPDAGSGLSAVGEPIAGSVPAADREPAAVREPAAGPTPGRRRKRLWRIVAAASAALLLLAGLVIFLPMAFDEPGSAGSAPERPATLPEAQAALNAAATALRARDRDAFHAALPARGPAARAAVDDLFKHLEALPWTGFQFVTEPVAGYPGRYAVTAVGQLGRVGPPDRVAALRRLDLRRLGGRTIVTGDPTPMDERSRYLMAFEHPVAVRRNGLLVLADRSLTDEALKVADAGAMARPALTRVGVAPQEPVLVSLYSSRRQLREALDGGPEEPRITFFSAAAPRLADVPWRTRDIGVLEPSLAAADAKAAAAGTPSWTPHMLAHELTHAFTGRWFAGTEHAPLLLLEGLATYVEGGRSYAPLKADLWTGDLRWPLPKSLTTTDLWKGNSNDDVELAYLEGGSLVSYVVDHWGRAKLRPFLVALADSDLTAAGVDAATKKTLGVSWTEFLDGWRQYVQTLD